MSKNIEGLRSYKCRISVSFSLKHHFKHFLKGFSVVHFDCIICVIKPLCTKSIFLCTSKYTHRNPLLNYNLFKHVIIGFLKHSFIFPNCMPI